jgi:hypothetical protein
MRLDLYVNYPELQLGPRAGDIGHTLAARWGPFDPFAGHA